MKCLFFPPVCGKFASLGNMLSIQRMNSYVWLFLSSQIQNIQLEREMALASNRSLAEQNLDMKPQLERERERLVLKYNELEEVRERYKQHCALRGKHWIY